MVNWDSILVNSKTEGIVMGFVNGTLTGKEAVARLRTVASVCPDYESMEFSRVVRTRGVTSTRTLARKALRRRNVTV